MSHTYVNARVLRNDGNTAIVVPEQEPKEEVTFLRATESLQEFLQMFPLLGIVQLFHPVGPLSPGESKRAEPNWISVKVLSNDGEEAILIFPNGVKIKLPSQGASKSDFLKSWPAGEMVPIQIRSMSEEDLSEVGEEALQQLVKLGVMEVAPGEFNNGSQVYRFTPFGLHLKEDPGWPSGNAQLEEVVDKLVLKGEIEITGYEGDKPIYHLTELGLARHALETGRPIEELRALPELNRRAEELWPSSRRDRRTTKLRNGD